jgi:hypothetical protein
VSAKGSGFENTGICTLIDLIWRRLVFFPFFCFCDLRPVPDDGIARNSIGFPDPFRLVIFPSFLPWQKNAVSLLHLLRVCWPLSPLSRRRSVSRKLKVCASKFRILFDGVPLFGTPGGFISLDAPGPLNGDSWTHFPYDLSSVDPAATSMTITFLVAAGAFAGAGARVVINLNKAVRDQGTGARLQYK